MGNIITTSQEVFGLNAAILEKKKETKKKIVVPQNYILRGKGLYPFVKRM